MIAMDKTTLLTASRVELGGALAPHSDLIKLLGPSLDVALQFQNILSTLSVFLCLRAWFLATATCAGICYASRLVALHAWVATKFAAFHGSVVSGKAIVALWDSKTIQKLRRKLFFEFAVFILGGGNMIFIVVLWPGWWIIGGVSLALWSMLG